MQNLLPSIALSLREKMFPENNKIILAMDSTPHEQHGLQMEGVEWNYKSKWCLDSQNVFDQFGFCYGFDLRSGATYSGNGATEMLERIMKSIPKEKDVYFRADSAYSNLATYNTLINNNIKFAVCLKETVWGPLLKDQEFKMKWKKTKMKFFESNKCQIASTSHTIKDLHGRSYLRVVFIRRKKTKEEKERINANSKKSTNKKERDYLYYAIITNMTEVEKNNENIIRFYRRRGNVENQIKDLKYGMDFLHFPCRSLRANAVWALMGIFAYNLMRFSSFLIAPEAGCFLKKVRNQMVKLPCEITKHARKITLKFSEFIYQEVMKYQESIKKVFQVVFYSNWRRGKSSSG